MNRRDFVKFLGVSTASLATADSLAKLNGVESQIILLDKKEIITASNSYDFIVKNIISISSSRNTYFADVSFNMTSANNPLDVNNISLEFEFYLDEVIHKSIFMSKHIKKQLFFTFDVNMGNSDQYKYIEALNNRMFKSLNYSVNSSIDAPSTVLINATEVI